MTRRKSGGLEATLTLAAEVDRLSAAGCEFAERATGAATVRALCGA